MTTPIAVTIAGSDSSGGAGIQADLKTFSALGVYGASVIAALTAQNTKGVTAIHDVPPDFIGAQIDAVFSDLDVKAVKIGMLSVPAAILAVADGLQRHRARTIVLDPVMVAASGDRLLAPDAVDVLRSALIPRALLLTRNEWDPLVEVTYSEYGERGSIDVLGLRRADASALVVEDKATFNAAEETMRTMDVKTRLAAKIVFDREGWRPRHVSRLLILEATMTNRRRVASHDALLSRAFPLRGDAARAWLRRPVGSVSALLFVPSSHPRTTGERGRPPSRR